jgi:hypothetical protein
MRSGSNQELNIINKLCRGNIYIIPKLSVLLITNFTRENFRAAADYHDREQRVPLSSTFSGFFYSPVL